MSEPRVHVAIFTDAELYERRATILRAVSVSEAELRARGAVYALNARELAALEEIKGLDYLLHGVRRE